MRDLFMPFAHGARQSLGIMHLSQMEARRRRSIDALASMGRSELAHRLNG
jgi:hypothetical protein